MYRFKGFEEAGWAAGVAGALVVLQALAELDFAAVTSWEVWLVALLGASVRAAAGAVLAHVGRPTPHG
ncbi:MAG: hypothetical protein GEU71_03725 [Actinobacteria bacterium]|nr:hypothetical protein [Actinomycetota bacterium]